MLFPIDHDDGNFIDFEVAESLESHITPEDDQVFGHNEGTSLEHLGEILDTLDQFLESNLPN